MRHLADSGRTGYRYSLGVLLAAPVFAALVYFAFEQRGLTAIPLAMALSPLLLLGLGLIDVARRIGHYIRSPLWRLLLRTAMGGLGAAILVAVVLCWVSASKFANQHEIDRADSRERQRLRVLKLR